MGLQAARAVLARAEIYADITSTLGGPLVLGSFPRVSAGVRAEIDVEMQKRNGECGGPAILSPLHLRGHLGVGQVASPFGRREARDVTADRAADGTADVAAVHDRHERQSTITVITGSTYALGVLYEPFELTSVALSDLMFDTDIIPATLTVSRYGRFDPSPPPAPHIAPCELQGVPPWCMSTSRADRRVWADITPQYRL